MLSFSYIVIFLIFGLSCYSTLCLFFSFFFGLLVTTEAMRILRFAGVFAVALRQSECGRKTCGMHVNQQVCIGVCYQLAIGCI
jgi:hypothetical protein